MQTQKTTKTKQKTRKTGKILTTPLYAYCEAANAKFARTAGRVMYGSFSGYVNALIAKDRGVKPKVGKRITKTTKTKKH